MNELKPCDARDMWNAVTELEDMALHPSIKKRLSAETLAIAIAAISEKAGQNRRPAPKNRQLTLEQLRQMDGEPVWWWNKSHAPVCTICIARFNEVSFVDFDYSHDDSTGIVKYERWVKWGFKPYARKPEQEEK